MALPFVAQTRLSGEGGGEAWLWSIRLGLCGISSFKKWSSQSESFFAIKAHELGEISN